MSDDEKSYISDESIAMPENVKKWIIYGASWCGFCRGALRLLNSHLEEYIYYDVDELGGALNTKNKLSHLTDNYKTIPLIFNYGKFIGGYMELKKHFSMMVENHKINMVIPADNTIIKIEKNIKNIVEETNKICYDEFIIKKYKLQDEHYYFKIKIEKKAHLFVKINKSYLDCDELNSDKLDIHIFRMLEY
jgi:glutaredoxin